ncbi:MAG: TetR/AcrR family transcriptional regulator [Clostridia bacterium]|nr:TetR/AcrR family transcriptional regulator [Clostridia bacterium]
MAAPRKENIKDMIMDATEKLLDSQSLDDISLAQIATEAGISKGTLYYHYKTKEDILLAIADRHLEEQLDDFLIWVDNKNKNTSLHRLMKYVIEYNVNGAGPRIHLIYNACLGNEDLREKILERYNKFQKLLKEKIEERADPQYADFLAWTALLVSDGLILQTGMKNPNIDFEDYVRHTDEILKALSEN